MSKCVVKERFNGSCCCNCINQRQLSKSPTNNKIAISKGSILKPFGWACAAPELEMGVFYDHKHGMCEMWFPKKSLR